MPAGPADVVVSSAEAEDFARRIGLSWLAQADRERLREAMTTIARAGLAVPRQSSKFDQPAFIFSVTSRT
jgi:aspartyl-tRNA(Asn)/glutamyl-tRNA(Gln) amidotransferase subunit A